MSQRPRILLVEEDADLRQSLMDAFDLFGFACHVCPSATEAIADAGGIPACDLLMVSYFLRGITGLGLAKQLRKFQPRLRVLMLASSVRPSILREIGLVEGCSALILPLEMDELEEAILGAVRGG